MTLFAMVIAVETGFAMSNGPATRIFESIACRQYYLGYDPTKIGEDGQVAEELCKVKEVQTELAAVTGYMEFFDGLLSAFLAIPYGLLADRYGRKQTILLNIPGFALNSAVWLAVLWFSDVLPLRTVWLSCLSWLFGGGPVVAFAIIWTMMADVTEEAERASIFFQFAVTGMVADFVSTGVSSLLMSMNPWIPMLIGMGITFTGVLLALGLPETMHVSTEQSAESMVELNHLPAEGENSTGNEYKDREEEHNGSHSRHSIDDVHGPATVPPTYRVTKLLRFIGRMIKQYRSSITPYMFIFRNKQIVLLLTAFLVYRLSRGSSWFLVQYISTRYSWTIANANLLISFKPALTVPLFLFILPAISRRLVRYMSPGEKDIRLARISIVCLTLGTLGIGLSPSIAMVIPSLIFQTCGAGFVFFIRSLITSLVNRDETARLYTVIEVIQAVGSVIASLSITNVFRLGIEMGGFWIGLAWMTTSSLFCMVGVAIYRFRLPSSARHDADEDVNMDMAEVAP